MSSHTPVKRVGLLSETFPPKPTWNVKDVPDLTGQTVLVTGGSSGIGKEMSRVSPYFGFHNPRPPFAVV